LSEENAQLKAKFNELEKIVLEGIIKKGEHYTTPSKYDESVERYEKKEIESEKPVPSAQ
jgi:hypothetical protein